MLFRYMTMVIVGIFMAQISLPAEHEPVIPAADKRPTKIWNRTGPLGETPKHVTDAYPLSDQENQGGRAKFEPMSDEFEGTELDRNKWHVGMEWWKGRQPALFSEKNVTVSDGKLQLTMRKEKLPPEAEKLGYKDYTSAALHTKARSSYGYYEVKAKPMNSGGSSSFWFQQDEIPGWATEIDVFEIGGKAKGFEHKYHMTLHVTQTPQEKKHWSVGGVWVAPWRLADDYHVYGFDWGKDELRFYVDGVLVRSVENTHWHQPLYLIFDSETMPQWFGMPEDDDLPSTFSIEYVRTWKKEGAQQPTTVSSEAILTFPKIDRHPAAFDERDFWLQRLIPEKTASDPFGSYCYPPDKPVTTLLGGSDLSGTELKGSLRNLLNSDFDTETIWPPVDRMPELFDPQKILDLGRSPGLGVRRLHASGVSGQGVGIALIDQPLLVEHQEYKSQLKLYEEIHVGPSSSTSVHGPAVASLAVGKTIGVAPEADLYYIGAWAGTGGGNRPFVRDYRYYAQAVRRILTISKDLPEGCTIRVVALPLSWDKNQLGYDDIMGACEEAQGAGLFVVSSSLEEMYGFKLRGLDRCPLRDPDSFESYELAPTWPEAIPHQRLAGRLLIPADSRTVAGYRGNTTYRFQRRGAWSSVIPYIAGVYALACQVDPKITPERFWESALKTGRTIRLKRSGNEVPLGPIIDPAALIEAIGRK